MSNFSSYNTISHIVTPLIKGQILFTSYKSNSCLLSKRLILLSSGQKSISQWCPLIGALTVSYFLYICTISFSHVEGIAVNFDVLCWKSVINHPLICTDTCYSVWAVCSFRLKTETKWINKILYYFAFFAKTKHVRVDQSRSKQCSVIPDFSIGQNLLKKILRKEKYWHNESRKTCWLIRWTQIM